MKIQLTAALTLAILAGSASASHIYGAFGTGNSDLDVGHSQSSDHVASIDQSQRQFDFHQGLHSPDLSPPPQKPYASARIGGGTHFDFHQGLSSPDLSR